MCLEYNKKISDDFWDVHDPEETGECWAYKICNFENGHLCSPYFTGTKIFPGKIISNRTSKNVNQNSIDDDFVQKFSGISTIPDYYGVFLHRGIHVFLEYNKIAYWTNRIAGDYATAGWFALGQFVVVKVKCLKEDFVGADSEGNAVFMKVELSKEEYDRAIKEAEQSLIDGGLK